MSTDIYTCANCGKIHRKFAIARKRNDFKTNPKPFCSKECAVQFLKIHAWKNYKLECASDSAVTWIIEHMNDPNYIPPPPTKPKNIEIVEDDDKP